MIWIILAVISLLVLVGAGYYYYMNAKPRMAVVRTDGSLHYVTSTLGLTATKSAGAPFIDGPDPRAPAANWITNTDNNTSLSYSTKDGLAMEKVGWEWIIPKDGKTGEIKHFYSNRWLKADESTGKLTVTETESEASIFQFLN